MFTNDAALEEVRMEAERQGQMVQWVYEMTNRKLEVGNKRIIEMGQNIAGLIAEQQN